MAYPAKRKLMVIISTCRVKLNWFSNYILGDYMVFCYENEEREEKKICPTPVKVYNSATEQESFPFKETYIL